MGSAPVCSPSCRQRFSVCGIRGTFSDESTRSKRGVRNLRATGGTEREDDDTAKKHESPRPLSSSSTGSMHRWLHGSRRMSLVTFIAGIPGIDAIAKGIGSEASLWKQEFEYYGNKFIPRGERRQMRGPPGMNKRRLDAEFANVLIRAMDAAAGITRLDEYRQRVDELIEKELPRFREAQACGHCGIVQGRGSYGDAAYFDFQTYIRGKVLLQMAPKIPTDTVDAEEEDYAYRKRDTYIRNARIAIGSYVLKHILEEIYTEDAEAMGISPFFSVTAANSKDSLLSASPDLDSIRAGVKSLLEYFQRKGYVQHVGISQFGLSYDEFENHMVWARGEPAYLKYWLTSPVDRNSSLALQTEEGDYLGYLSATIAAFLRRCGVVTTNLRRIQSLSDEENISEQSTIRRIKSLPASSQTGKKPYAPWKPDVCPNGAYDNNCY
mmetsp:Transcript_11127/g.22235  ORF Transcript_11127/g.22235 Transcript_11127/m.22235 type:complete len:437 (+) Transcript_11127:93-1403(+)